MIYMPVICLCADDVFESVRVRACVRACVRVCVCACVREQTLRMIEKMKNQFKQLLREIHFYDRRSEREYNEHSDNMGLVKAVMVAGK